MFMFHADGGHPLNGDGDGNETGDEKCEECYRAQAREDHPCPFQQEFRDNHKNYCNCCFECTDSCAQRVEINVEPDGE